MSQRRSPTEILLSRVLERARELARQVRQAAESVEEQAKEAHRLTEIAKRQSKRGRELSEAGCREARAVTDSIRRTVDRSGKARNHGSRDDEA